MRKSFSLMLAWRYLNPRRAWISSITMISVLGVLLGVLVLVVVMAVYAGLEREQKRRLLGFSPHILLQYSETGGRLTTIENWGEVIERMKNIPGVVTAYPHVEDNAVLDSEDMQRPVSYQGLETNDPLQLKGVEDMLDLEHYPGSTADMGLDARVVVSSIMAAQYQWKLGDKINLYSTRNLQQVLRGYKSAEQPVVRERFSDKIKAVGELIEKQWLENDEGFTMNRAMIDVLNQLYEIEQTADLRGNEHETILGMLAVVDAATLDKDNDTFHFAAGSKEEFSLHWKKILGTSQDELDAQVLKNLKDIVLPREVEIVGVFQSSQMVKMPDLFVPLSLAQGLSALGEGIQGVALRIDDAYLADQFIPKILPLIDQHWLVSTWADQYAQFFSLISQQRVMMYFVLSFIVLISAFSMMAVMFTVTIQKKREIGVMKALGATPWQIMRVFLYQGSILGVAGSALGVFLGRIVVFFRGSLQDVFRRMDFDPFSSRLTGFDTLPAFMDWREQIFIGCMGMLLCMVASLVPAFFAARSDAAKSLRSI
jgi:lipoprotein-releasing system permease protein